MAARSEVPLHQSSVEEDLPLVSDIMPWNHVEFTDRELGGPVQDELVCDLEIHAHWSVDCREHGFLKGRLDGRKKEPNKTKDNQPIS